jgi:Tol biopolymer transport system component
MTADSKKLVAVQRQFRVNIFDAEMLPSGIGPAVQVSAVTMGGGDAVNTTTVDGRILFVSEADGDRDIWIMNSDGKEKRQLTFGPPMDSGANLSPDGRQIVYARASMGIWKMDLDGNNREQLAEKGMFPDFSPDGQWVFYTLPKDRWSLWKVAADGGESLRVTDYPAIQPSFSPDGKYLAFLRFLDLWSAELDILTADTLELVKTLEVLQPRSQFEIDWTRDSSGIIYNATLDGIDKIVLQPFAGGEPQILLSAKSPAETLGGFSMSPDVRRLYFSAGPVDHNVVMFTLER